ncbi:MAG: carboxypeptidase regulatory-like domain-containing protein [Candidatus Sulfopaludibacter sp.]|nr:carboxypeptidase regulatory-like domain-containing protein [Candidatus Sulfopaludibacter sp.]
MRTAVCVLILWAGGAAAQSVEGTVVDSLTGNGIPGVKVELVRLSESPGDDIITQIAGTASYSATTDRQGRFLMEDVKAGTYTARYRAANHIDEAMAPKRDVPALPKIQVPERGSPVKLAARMIPLGGLSGRVVDGRGQPVPHARVDFETGNLMGSQDTDKDGKFSEMQFPGDLSVLSAVPPSGWKPPDPDPDTGQARAWVRTYYPGVADEAAAQKIVGRPGVWQTDIELKLVAVPTHSVRGIVLNPDGTPAAKVPVAVGEDFFTPVVRAQTKADGTFEFPAVADGLWRVSSDVERGDTKLRAATWVLVTGRELEGLKLRLAAQVTVRGRVIMEAVQGRPSPKPPMLRLRAFAHGRMSEAAPPGWPDAGGNFAMPYFYPGIYRFDGLNTPVPGYYLAEVRLAESVLAAPDVEIASGALPLTLTYKTNGGTVRGSVESCGGGEVMLAPRDPALRWPQSVLTAQCDANDRYQIASARPGDYYALAFPADRSARIRFLEFEESMTGQAVRVELRAGETTSLDLRIPR